MRHGATLFINDQSTRIRTQFILIESGGLFQAGSKWNNSYRFQSPLSIILTHPKEGYSANKNVASQYSYTVYAPGVKRVEKDQLGITTYLGNQNPFVWSSGI